MANVRIDYCRVFKSWLNATKLCLSTLIVTLENVLPTLPKLCVGHGQIALAERAAERCAYYEQNCKGADSADKGSSFENKLPEEYLLLRITLVRHESRAMKRGFLI